MWLIITPADWLLKPFRSGQFCWVTARYTKNGPGHNLGGFPKASGPPFFGLHRLVRSTCGSVNQRTGRILGLPPSRTQGKKTDRRVCLGQLQSDVSEFVQIAAASGPTRKTARDFPGRCDSSIVDACQLPGLARHEFNSEIISVFNAVAGGHLPMVILPGFSVRWCLHSCTSICLVEVCAHDPHA